MLVAYATVGTNDLEKAIAFYDALLGELGIGQLRKLERGVFYGRGDFEFAVLAPFDGNPATVGNGSMSAMRTDSTAMVDKVHAMALSLGGANEGDPRLRGRAESGFYGAYFRDLDGNKLCIFATLRN